ncbi:hypothetical protein JOF53_006434 [Crossiella equi]|uniref:Uncharacterized protein n=1 Tax=Crossiella equi TaxID=130796 RepID=A0ABS5ALX1_9PSEU|nr:hypothetical protein [Crossiella equi]
MTVLVTLVGESREVGVDLGPQGLGSIRRAPSRTISSINDVEGPVVEGWSLSPDVGSGTTVSMGVPSRPTRQRRLV